MARYILRKQIGPRFKNKFLYFNGCTIDSSDFSKYTTTSPSEATILTDEEVRAFSSKIHAGAFVKVKI